MQFGTELLDRAALHLAKAFISASCRGRGVERQNEILKHPLCALVNPLLKHIRSFEESVHWHEIPAEEPKQFQRVLQPFRANDLDECLTNSDPTKPLKLPPHSLPFANGCAPD